jgi:hypothetical protein
MPGDDQMRDPPPWSRDPRGRPGVAQLLLRGARRPQAPANDDLVRLGSAVARIPRRSALAARRRSRLGTAAAAAIVVASLGTAVWALRGRRPPAPAAPQAAVAPVIASAARPNLAPFAPPPPAQAPADAPEEKAVVAPGTTSPTAVAEPAHRARHRPEAQTMNRQAADPQPGADALTREIALIDDARANLVAAPARALASLERHRREFARGQLGAERELLTVEALRRLNRTEEARQRAAALQVDYPSSSYAARARRLLQSTP